MFITRQLPLVHAKQILASIDKCKWFFRFILKIRVCSWPIVPSCVERTLPVVFLTSVVWYSRSSPHRPAALWALNVLCCPKTRASTRCCVRHKTAARRPDCDRVGRQRQKNARTSDCLVLVSAGADTCGCNVGPRPPGLDMINVWPGAHVLPAMRPVDFCQPQSARGPRAPVGSEVGRPDPARCGGPHHRQGELEPTPRVADILR